MTAAAAFGLNENALNFSIKGIVMYFSKLIISFYPRSSPDDSANPA
jgi:hypothetical protein